MGAVSVISEKKVLQTDFEPNKKSCKEIPVIMAFYVISYGDIEPDLLVAKTRFTRVT